MKAYILEAPYRLTLASLSQPDIGDYDALVRVRSVGICGSDVEVYKGSRELEGASDPVRLGHEAAGVVEAIGRHVTGLAPGDPVAVRGVWGCFAQYVKASMRPPTECVSAPFHQAVKLPAAIPMGYASLMEVVPKILKTAARAGVTPATNVLIKGQGVSGLLLTQAVRLWGPNMLVVSDLFGEKLELAHELGATHTINAVREDLGERVRELMPNGADVIITAHLEGEGVVESIELLKWGGRIVLYGCLGKAPGLDFYRLHTRGGDILAARMDSLAEDRMYCDMAIDYVQSGLIDLCRIITHRFTFDQVPEAFKLKEEPRGDVIHAVVSL